MEREPFVKERESFSSRLGFVLISAGCAIGLGNVWRFPYITGKYGGAAFVLIYLVFLAVLGLPVMVMEFSVGRASRKSIALSFHALEPKGTKWHIYSWFGIAGNYLLFCVSRRGWGWDRFLAEANTGGGIRFPARIRRYVTWVLPLIVLFIFVMGYWNKFFA